MSQDRLVRTELQEESSEELAIPGVSVLLGGGNDEKTQEKDTEWDTLNDHKWLSVSSTENEKQGGV